MSNRIYVVSKDGNVRLVNALNKARALKHVASEYKVEIASQNDLVSALTSGVIVEQDTDQTAE